MACWAARHNCYGQTHIWGERGGERGLLSLHTVHPSKVRKPGRRSPKSMKNHSVIPRAVIGFYQGRSDFAPSRASSIFPVFFQAFLFFFEICLFFGGVEKGPVRRGWLEKANKKHASGVTKPIKKGSSLGTRSTSQKHKKIRKTTKIFKRTRQNPKTHSK